VSGLVVQRWYPVGGLYVNGRRVLTQQPEHRGPVLTVEQTPDDVQAEFSSLLRENLELRRQLADSDQSSGSGGER